MLIRPRQFLELQFFFFFFFFGSEIKIFSQRNTKCDIEDYRFKFASRKLNKICGRFNSLLNEVRFVKK
jgi:hypothetical protein